MSDIAMLINGSGLEAFGGGLPPDLPVDISVDTREEVAAAGALDEALADVGAGRERLVALQEVQAYGESIRETLSETAAEELQRRVVEVLGVERGVTVVGSVESYNGPLAGSLLTAGLESVGGFIKAAIAELIKLIRNGIKTFIQYFSSARALLNKQIEANNTLNELLNGPKAQWDGWSIEVKHVYQGFTFQSGSMNGNQLRALCMKEGSTLDMPSSFYPALTATANELINVAGPAALGLVEHYRDVLRLVSKAPNYIETANVLNLAKMQLEGYLPLSRMLSGNVDAKSGLMMVSTKQLLGAKVFGIRATPRVLYAREAGRYDAMKVVEGLALTKAGMYPLDLSSAKSRIQVRSLSQIEARASLNQMNNVVNTFLRAGFNEEVVTLSNYAEKLATDVLPQLSNATGLNYATRVTEIMGALTTLTTATPRGIMGYINELSDAVRAYVSVSARLI